MTVPRGERQAPTTPFSWPRHPKLGESESTKLEVK